MDIFCSLSFLFFLCSLLAGVSWGDYVSILLKCTEVLDLIKSMHLPLIKPRWAEFTDAGPGVGVSNFEVIFRDAELAHMFYLIIAFGFIRLLAIVDRTRRKGQIQQYWDAVVDGSTINWEYRKWYDKLSEDEISFLSLQEYEEMEEEPG